MQTRAILGFGFVLISLLISTSPTACRAETPTGVGILIEMLDKAIIGGWNTGKWISSKDASILVKKGDKVRIFSFDSLGSETEVVDVAEPIGPFLGETKGIKVPEEATRDGYGYIGASNPLPRKPFWIFRKEEAISSFPLDLQIISKLKDCLGLHKTLPGRSLCLVDWVRMDFDNDGKIDHFVVGKNWERDETGYRGVKKGDSTIVLFARGQDRGYSFLRVWSNFSEENYSDEKPAEWLEKPSLQGVYDINGDGIMEAVIMMERYEAGSFKVFEIKGREFVSVFEISYGF